jgi:hypothetical protein
MDWMEQEQERGITITSAATTCMWKFAPRRILICSQTRKKSAPALSILLTKPILAWYYDYFCGNYLYVERYGRAV